MAWKIAGEHDILIIRDSLLQTVPLFKTSAGNSVLGNENLKGDEAWMTLTNPEAMRFLIFHEEMHYRRIAMLMDIVQK